MSLVDQMEEDIESVFCNPDDFGVSIFYQRGTTPFQRKNSQLPINATVSQTLFETQTEFGVKRVETRDYLFKPD